MSDVIAVCPWCQKKRGVMREEVESVHKGGSAYVRCPNCGKTYEVFIIDGRVCTVGEEE